jgi:hypothetical protein
MPRSGRDGEERKLRFDGLQRSFGFFFLVFDGHAYRFVLRYAGSLGTLSSGERPESKQEGTGRLDYGGQYP